MRDGGSRFRSDVVAVIFNIVLLAINFLVVFGEDDMKKIILLGVVAVLALVLSAHIANNTAVDSGSVSTSFRELLPAEIANLPEGFYPGGLTRQSILARLPEAVEKTGDMESDEWSGVIRVTGDMHINDLTIRPGTIVFIEANSDDQNDGWPSNVDPVNPHEFFDENYSFGHVFIQISGELIARGTADEPIVITSTSDSPRLADWEKITFNSGALEYAVVEYGIGMATVDSDATVSHCLVRNMLAQGVMFGTWPEAGIYGESVSPEITHNYMYNFGHMAVQSFFSEPHIINNIFIQKNTGDSELYDFLNLGESAALDIHGGDGTVEHNFLSSGYDPGFEKGNQPSGPGIVITEATRPVIRFNTIAGNRWGIELQGGMPTVSNNNIYQNVDGNLVVRRVYAEPGRESETMEYDEPLDFANNYWGTGEMNSVIGKMSVDHGIEVSVNPISGSPILGSGPDWGEFEWLYG